MESTIMNGKWTKENFEKHDAANPHIYSLFKRFSLQASNYKKKYSAKSIFHRIRWETMVTEYDSDFKIDDGWIAHYARKFMSEHPHLSEFFETRVRKDSYHKTDKTND
jgi:hypothetical protein